MLSIIVSSYQTEYFEQFSTNVKKTIGDNFEYEIIQQWNPAIMSICKAYNKGAEKAQYENLLFIHEDVLFETQDWGNILVDYLQLDNIGCVSLAGSNYIPNTPTPWWVVEGYANSHLSHFSKLTNKRVDYTFVGNENGLLNAKIIDGVFIACKKNVWNKVKFNENLKGFHGYDISFSLSISHNFQNYIQNKISLVHFSPGNLSKEWLIDVIKAYSLVPKKESRIDKNTELICFNYFADQLRHLQFSSKEKENYLYRFISIKHLGILNWIKAKRKIKAIKKYNN